MSEIGVRLNGDSSGYTSMMQRAGAVTEGTFTEIGKKLFSVKTIATSVGTALGLHYSEIAETVARAVTGMSKETEEALKKIEQLGAETAQIYEQIFDKRKTDAQALKLAEEKTNSLLAEREAIYRAVAAREKEAAELASSALSKQTYGYLAISEAKAKALMTDEESVKLAQIARDLADKNRVIEEKTAAIKKTEAEELKKYNDENSDWFKAQADAELALAKRSRELQDEQQKDRLANAKENFEQLMLEQKARIGIIRGASTLTKEESDRLEVLKLQSKEKSIQASLEVLLSKPISERSKGENVIIEQLIEQQKLTKQQIADKTKVVEKTEAQAVAESRISDELAKQSGFTFTGSDESATNEKLNDAQLQEKSLNLKSQIAELRMQRNEINKWSTDALLRPLLNSERQIQEEATARFQFRTSAKAFGVDAALSQVSAFDQDRFRGYVQNASDSQKVVDSLTTISGQLDAAGFRASPTLSR